MLKIAPDPVRFQIRTSGPIGVNGHLFSPCFPQTDGDPGTGLLKSNLRQEEEDRGPSLMESPEHRGGGTATSVPGGGACLVYQTQQVEIPSESGGHKGKLDENLRDISPRSKEPARGRKCLPINTCEDPSSYDGERPTVTALHKGSTLVTQTKADAADQEWKVVKVTPIVISHMGPAQKPNLSRSASLSEKELKDAKDRSQKIAAQLTTPPSSSSKGVLLFNKRKQRVNKFTWESYGKGREGLVKEKRQGYSKQSTAECEKEANEEYSVEVKGLKSWFSCEDSSVHCAETRQVSENNMEEYTDSINYTKPIAQTMEPGSDAIVMKDTHPTEVIAEQCAVSSFTKREGSPMKTELQVDLMVPATNGHYNSDSLEDSRHISEIQCNLEVQSSTAKQASVLNRTARPFGIQSPIGSNASRELSPVVDVVSPPKYTASFSSPPSINRVTSPTLFIASCPSTTEQKSNCEQGYNYRPNKPAPVQKTGILENTRMHKEVKKPMFTFHEKPKVSPNPDLLAMVQNADEKRKQKEQPETPADEEHLALGAEASNFLHKNTSAQGTASEISEKAPEWTSCLKSSDTRMRLNSKPVQSLPEAKGKGAELFAKRQSRMEKYVVESPAVSNTLTRSPSPTMSLPSAWKYSTSAEISSRVFPNRSKTPTYPSRVVKPQSTSSFPNYVEPVENNVSKKGVEIAKRQPYQLNSALFILSPVKDPVSSLPKAAPPPKPRVHDPLPLTRQSSYPLGYTPPSPAFDCPTPFRSTRQPVTPQSPVPINGIGNQDINSSEWAAEKAADIPSPSPLSPSSPYRISSPKPKEGVQAPRPSFSAKKAGIEPQARKESLPASPSWTPNLPRRFSSFERGSSVGRPPSISENQTEPQRSVFIGSPSPTSPPWSERSLSPLGQDIDPKANKSMQAMIARNIINAARKKSTSPTVSAPNGQRSLFSPTSRALSPTCSQLVSMSPIPSRQWTNHSPIPISPPETPVHIARSPVKLYNTRSLTDSDVSVDSEDSGMRSPGIRSFNICPKGWGGSLRLKRGSIPSEASCAT